MKKNNYLIILAGLPASGKTTFARQFKSVLESQEKNKVHIVDPDKIREEFYIEGFRYQEEQNVRKRSLRKVKVALQHDYVVINDDLNYYRSMRHDLKLIAEKLNTQFFIIHISTPLEVCLKWNQKRGSILPEDVIIKISEKFDLFDRYSWDNPFINLNLARIDNLRSMIEEIIKKINLTLITNQKDIQHRNNLGHCNSKYTEELDIITRRVVNEILSKEKNHPQKDNILELRKEFVELKAREKLKIPEIPKRFIEFLKERLKLEV